MVPCVADCCSLDVLDGGLDGASKKGEQSQVTKGSPDPLLWVSSAVSKSVDNTSCHPDPASRSCQLRMRQPSHGQQEEELRKILKSVLVSSLDTIEGVAVLAVHFRILYSILLSSLEDENNHV